MYKNLLISVVVVLLTTSMAFATPSGLTNSDSIQRVNSVEATVNGLATFGLSLVNLSDGSAGGSDVTFDAISYADTQVEANSYKSGLQCVRIDVTNNSAAWGLVVYTDNTDGAVASPVYTGANVGMSGSNPSGLVGVSDTTAAALLLWQNSLSYDSWSAAPTELAGVSTENWAIMRDIGTTDYVWNTAQANYMTAIKGGSGWWGLPGGKWSGGFLDGSGDPVTFIRLYGRFYQATPQVYRTTSLTFELYHE